MHFHLLVADERALAQHARLCAEQIGEILLETGNNTIEERIYGQHPVYRRGHVIESMLTEILGLLAQGIDPQQIRALRLPILKLSAIWFSCGDQDALIPLEPTPVPLKIAAHSPDEFANALEHPIKVRLRKREYQ